MSGYLVDDGRIGCWKDEMMRGVLSQRSLRFEQLEARCVLSTVVPGLPEAPVRSAPDAVPSEEHDPSCNQHPDFYVREGTLLDAGDFYWYYGEKMSLLRVQNEIVVGLRDGVDPTTAAEQLTDVNGPLAGWTRVYPGNRSVLMFRWEPEESNVGRAFSDAEQRLAEVPQVAWTGPMHYSPRSRLRIAVTDEIVVSVSSKDLLGEEVISYREFIGLGTYIVKLAGGGGLHALELANQLGASLNFLGQVRFFPICHHPDHSVSIDMGESLSDLPDIPDIPDKLSHSPVIIYPFVPPDDLGTQPLPPRSADVDTAHSPIGVEASISVGANTGHSQDTPQADVSIEQHSARKSISLSELDLLFGESLDPFNTLSVLDDGLDWTQI